MQKSVQIPLPQKCRSNYHKNTARIATKIPVEMPQKCRLMFTTYTIPINCKIIQECREMGFILCAIAHTVFPQCFEIGDFAVIQPNEIGDFAVKRLFEIGDFVPLRRPIHKNKRL
jgi:hypothetical protein